MTAEFTHRNNQFYCEDVPVDSLADEYDTPLYVYSQNHFQNRIENFKDALSSVDHEICYAVKCNGNLSVLNRMAEIGSGFDIVSGGELRRVLEAGGDPSQVVFAGVGKTRAEQEMALDAGILMFNVESVPEMQQLSKVAGEMGTTADIALRVNPDVDAKTHDKISTGKKENKFGLPIALIDDYVDEAASLPNISLEGLHFHIGSQITTIEPFEKMIDKASSLVDRLREEGHDISTLNLGGGIGIRYRDEQPLTPYDWADAVLPEIEKRDLRLIVEPGRFLMGNAGVLVTQVEYVKESVTKNFVVVDGGMNDLIRPAMYDAYHEIVPLNPRNADHITADVVGPICESSDYFGKDRELPEPQPGDYLAIKSAGAYGFAMASQYNAFPRPAEILVDENSHTVVREPEDYSDLWAGEKNPRT
ncbi:MAG: diaminopimelate decarboxylase [bacterium]